MAAPATPDKIIERVFTVPGYGNPLAWDPDDLTIEGHWICRVCLSYFEGNRTIAPHKSGCPLAGRFSAYKGALHFVHTIGPNATPDHYRPLDASRFQQVKRDAPTAADSWCVVL